VAVLKPSSVDRYPRNTRLRHHGGSVWSVIRYVPYTNGDDVRIRCVVGTVRPDQIGGEREGDVRQVHADYLHGDGWRLDA